MRKYQKINWDEVVKNYHSGDPSLIKKAQEDALIGSKGFILTMMKRKYSNFLHREGQDLLQCGYVAILEHLGEYDPRKGKPSTFFDVFIENRLAAWINNNSSYSTSYYTTVRNKIKKVVRENEELKLTCEEIAEKTGLSAGQVKNSIVHDLRAEKHSIDDVALNTPSPYSVSSDDALGRNDESQRLHAWIEAVLTSTEKDVLYNLFGFTTGAPMSVSAGSKKLRMTKELVGETRDLALKKLRETEMYDPLDGGSIICLPQKPADLEIVDL